MPNPFDIEGNLRYSRTSFDDYLSWPLFEKLKVGVAVPFLGTNALRMPPLVAWHTPPLGQFFHTHHYRLKRTIAEGSIAEFCKALPLLNDLDEPITDKQKLPALSLACRVQRELMARVLVMRGAGLDAPDALGQTPLHHSVNTNSFECAKLLLDSGADPTVKDRFGVSAIDLARAKGQGSMLKLLEAPRGAPRLVGLAVRNSLRESAQFRRRLLGRLRREAFGAPAAYPFNNLKGVYTVSFRN